MTLRVRRTELPQHKRLFHVTRRCNESYGEEICNEAPYPKCKERTHASEQTHQLVEVGQCCCYSGVFSVFESLVCVCLI